MKTCNKCGEEKCLDEFYNHATTKDGKHVSCKECVKERSRRWRKANPKPKKERGPRMDGFRLLPKGMRRCSNCREVKEKCLFYKDSGRASGVSSKCKKCTNEYFKERRRDPSVDTLTARRKWREENRERLRKQDAKYREANRERRSLNESKRRARKQELPDTLTIAEIEEIVEKFDNKCAVCSWDYEHLDHFIPLNTGRGGTIKGNMVPMCQAHNTSKNARNPFEWADKYLSELERERFDILVEYLTELNGIADVEDYKAHVYQCFK